MDNRLSQVSESEAVQPTEIHRINFQGDLIDWLIAHGIALQPPAPHHQDEAFIPGNNFKTLVL